MYKFLLRTGITLVILCFLTGMASNISASSPESAPSSVPETTASPEPEAGSPPVSVPAPGDNRIVVLPLATGSWITPTWKGTFNPGDALTEILTRRLAASGKYLAVDSAQVKSLIQGNRLQVTGAVSPDTLVQIGKLATARYVVYGTVTEFYLFKLPDKKNDKNKTVTKSYKLHAVVDFQVVDLTTGLVSPEILITEETIVPDNDFKQYFKDDGTGYFNSDLLESETGKLLAKIADKGVQKIETAEFKYGIIFKSTETYVLHVDGTMVFLNAGNRDGVLKGMVFSIYRTIPIKDPSSGDLRKLYKPIAEIKIIDVEEDSSVGLIQEKSCEIQPLARAKRKK